ncbi:MAG: acylglycerol kinase family protein [Desulfobacterium sp.]|jgi:diacylglycerol kinase (ATP)|nr:acylglycerol kinase family protein [Desulfobacterium sp.]
MHICLIYNKQAGAADLISKFMFHLGAEHRCELCPTSVEQHAGLIAREAVQKGYDRIVAAGGDGTLNQIVNGIAPDFDAVELALLPLGTGNDLGRVLNLSVDNQDEACVRVLSRRVEPVDVIRISSADSYS